MRRMLMLCPLTVNTFSRITDNSLCAQTDKRSLTAVIFVYSHSRVRYPGQCCRSRALSLDLSLTSVDDEKQRGQEGTHNTFTRSGECDAATAERLVRHSRAVDARHRLATWPTRVDRFIGSNDVAAFTTGEFAAIGQTRANDRGRTMAGV